MATNTYTGIQDPNRGFRVWNRTEIFDPDNPSGPGEYVPNVDDAVHDWDRPNQLRVVEVDYTTGRSVLEEWTPPKDPGEENNLDVLLGVGPGYASETYRMFLDQSVTPHTFSPDSRLHFYGSDTDYYKVFLGTDTSEVTGKVISAFYDPSGNFMGTSIPLENITVARNSIWQKLFGFMRGSLANGDESVPIKALASGYTMEALGDGEVVTIVAYTADGEQRSIAQLLVVNSAAIRQADTAKKYVASIQLDTPFVSSSDPQVIEFPLNVAVASLPLTALVHYSDGSKVRYSIDGSKFSLLGIDSYIATTTGQEFPMVLSYLLSDDEVSYTLEPTANRRLTVPYYARTISADGAYEVKLFVYPVWVSPEVGYRLTYWLYNLDRQTYYNVTPHIELGANSAPFNPTTYGTTQTLTVAVNLNNVDSKFAPYRHVQTFQVALLTRGDAPDQDNWLVYHTPQQENAYGRDAVAKVTYVNTNYWELDLSCGKASQETWLRDFYERINPLLNTEVETTPLTPTHFEVMFLHNTYRYEVGQWNETLTVNNDLDEGEVVWVRWLRVNYDTTLELGMSAFPLHQTTTP